jgi:hypothetical protein
MKTKKDITMKRLLIQNAYKRGKITLEQYNNSLNELNFTEQKIIYEEQKKLEELKGKMLKKLTMV